MPSATPTTKAAKSAKKSIPVPNGITKPQARRYLELLRQDPFEAWSYLRDRLNASVGRLEVSEGEARMNLWAARSGHPFCLGEMSWAPHYTDEEQLFLLETCRDRMDQKDDGDPICYISWYGKFFLKNVAAVSEIVTTHERAVNWQASRIRAFRLMSWLAMPDSAALQLHERLGIVAALARLHVLHPDQSLGGFDLNLLKRNGGKPWLARDLALAVGTMQMWIEALMKLEDENGSSVTHYMYSSSCRFARVRDIFSSLLIEDVERFLPDYDANAMPGSGPGEDDLLAFDTFFRERGMTPAEILRIAQALAASTKPRAAPSRLVDILCLVAGPQLPLVDELLSFSLVDDEWAKRYIAFFAKMPPSRRRELVERDLASEDSNGGGMLVIAADASLASFTDRYKTKHVCPAFARHGETTPPDMFDKNDTSSLERIIAPLADDRVKDSSMFAREALHVLVRHTPSHPRVVALHALIREKLGAEALAEVIRLTH